MGSPVASTPAVSKRMRQTRRRDTPKELDLRRELHRRGLRYLVDAAPLPGLRRRADLVFRRPRVAVFVDGCFWHQCPKHKTMPVANREWWSEKLAGNVDRDRDTDQAPRRRLAGYSNMGARADSQCRRPSRELCSPAPKRNGMTCRHVGLGPPSWGWLFPTNVSRMRLTDGPATVRSTTARESDSRSRTGRRERGRNEEVTPFSEQGSDPADGVVAFSVDGRRVGLTQHTLAYMAGNSEVRVQGQLVTPRISVDSLRTLLLQAGRTHLKPSGPWRFRTRAGSSRPSTSSVRAVGGSTPLPAAGSAG